MLLLKYKKNAINIFSNHDQNIIYNSIFQKIKNKSKFISIIPK